MFSTEVLNVIVAFIISRKLKSNKRIDCGVEHHVETISPVIIDLQIKAVVLRVFNVLVHSNFVI